MSVAALEAALRLYANGLRDQLPLWGFFSAKRSVIAGRAKGLASCLDGASVRGGQSVVGGGSLPGYGIPSAELVLPVASASTMAARLRQGRPPVFCRIDGGDLLFDLRTVPQEDDDRLLRAIRYALDQG